MNAFTASIARRSAVLSAGFAATLAGHVLSGASLRVIPIAPLLWLGLLGVSIVATRRRALTTFKAWSPVATLGALLVVQALMHLLLSYAPWTLGFMAHSAHGGMTAAALLAHVAVALVLLAPLCWGQRVLERAVAVVRRIVRPGYRPVAPRPPRIIRLDQRCPAPPSCAAPLPARGPPAWRSPRALARAAPVLNI